MTSQLDLFNEALTDHLGERKLSSLAEARESQRVLTDIWNRNGMRQCLEQGHWKFAQRTVKVTASTTLTPAFGYLKAFEKPTDCVRVSKLCSDERFNTPLTEYVEETGYWFADLNDIYVSHVSDEIAYGGDLTLWPESFSRYVASYLAYRAAGRIAGSESKRDSVEKAMNKLLIEALSKDAMQGPTAFPPIGRFVSARMGGRTIYDRGNRGRLIG